MTFFGQLGGNPLGLLFILLSLFNAYYGWRIALDLRRRWGSFQREPLRSEQKQLIDRAAFFLGVPLGVIIHEFGHALTTWLLGGRVVDAGYGFYWGYVVPVGDFSPAQFWLISIAGTIGSLLYGVTLWLLFRRIPISTYRYFGLRVLRVHLYYSLVFYPLFSAFTFVGDWRYIYDFGSTPVLSSVTLVVHLGVLGLFWLADRRGLFEMPGFNSIEAQQHFAELKSQTARMPKDPQLQVKFIEACRQSGMTNTTRSLLRDFLKENPNSAQAHLQLAAIYAQGRREIPRRAREHAVKALNLGLSEPTAVAYANQLIGQYNLGVGRLDEAVDRFSQGIAAAQRADKSPVTAHLNYLRAVAYRRKGQYYAANQDIQQAIRLARATGHGNVMSLYEAELTTIENHSGRSIGSPPA